MSESPDLPSIDARSGDGPEGRRRIGRNPAEGDVGSAGTLPRIAAAVANPLTGRGTRYCSRRTTPGPASGARFRGTNAHQKKSWTTNITVDTCDPGREFSFEVTAGGMKVARWSYQIEPIATGRESVLQANAGSLFARTEAVAA